MSSSHEASLLVFYLLDEGYSNVGKPEAYFAADIPELVIDESTPRFLCQHLSAETLGVEEALTLNVCGKSLFFLRHLAMARDPRERREWELLRDWAAKHRLDTIAYQWKLGAEGIESPFRADDVLTYWDELGSDSQTALLASKAVPCWLRQWFEEERGPISLAEEERLFAELLSASADNLPYYEHVFRSLLMGDRHASTAKNELPYRFCDHVAKMFIRFPTYLSRRFLRSERDPQGRLRALYLQNLVTAFQFNVAPVSLDRFCDYLSVKADCHGQERADLAWFVGELSILARPAMAFASTLGPAPSLAI